MDQKVLFEVAPKQLDRVLSFFARVEAKASFVFAINSALLGVLAVHVERADLYEWLHCILLVLVAGGLGVSYYFVYRCSFPNLSGGHLSLVYFKEIAKLREQQYVRSFRDMTEDAYVDDVLSQVWRNAEILTEKFRAIKVAFVITGLCLLPWAAFLTVASITHILPSIR
jgi:hypothetical protein